MSKLKILLLFPALMILTLNANSATLEKLSLKQAIDYTLTANPQIKESKNSLLSSQSRLLIASHQMSSSAGADSTLRDNAFTNSTQARAFGRWEYFNFGGTTASIDLTPFADGNSNTGVNFQLRKPFGRGSGYLSDRGYSLLNAQSNLSVQQNQTFLSRQGAVLAVVRSYFNAVLAREQISVQEKALATTKQQAIDAKKRSDAGLIAEIEVSRAEIQVAQSEEALNQRVQSAKAALDNLLLNIGEGMGQTPELVDSIPEVEAAPVVPEQDAALKVAMVNRKQLINYDIQLSDQQRSLEIVSDQLKPSIDAIANFNTSGRQNNNQNIFDNKDLTVGLQYSIPLDKKIIQEQRKMSERELELLTQLRSFEVDQVNNDVRNAYRSLDSAKASLNILGQNLQTAKNNLSMAQRMVEEGLSSNREVLDAQESLRSVESGILSARVNYYLAALNVKDAMGEDLIETVFFK